MRFPTSFLVPILALLAVSSARPLSETEDKRDVSSRATSTQEAIAFYTTVVETQHTTQTSTITVVTATQTAHVTQTRTETETETEVDTVTAYVVASGLPCQAGGGQPVVTFTDTAVGATSTSNSTSAPGSGPGSNNLPSSGPAVSSPDNSPNTGSSGSGPNSNPGSGPSPESTSPLTVPIARPDGSESHVDMDVPNMTPIVPPNVDPGKIDNIKPVDQGDMYYSPEGHNDTSIEHKFTLIKNNYTYPAIIVEHSQYITSVTCETGGIAVDFSSAQAYDFAKQNWKPNFLLITSSTGQGCNSSATVITGEYTYWLVTDVSFQEGPLIVHANATVVPIERAIKTAEITWGTVIPGRPASGNNGTASSGSGVTVGGSFNNGTTGSSNQGGSGTGSGTNGTTTSPNVGTNGTCAPPPSDQILGFPTAPLCDDFDKLLDDKIGYFDFDADSFDSSFDQFAPGLASEDDIDSFYKRSSIRKRFIPRFLVRLGQGILQVATAPVAVPLRIARAYAPAPVKHLLEKASTLDKEANKQIDYVYNVTEKAKPELQRATRWGPGRVLWSKKKTGNKNSKTDAEIHLSCVNCGFETHINIAGKVVVDFLTADVRTAHVNVAGNIMAEANLAIEAMFTFKDGFQKELAVFPLPGLAFAVPGFFTVGPALSVHAKGDFELKAEGGVIAGGKAEIKNFNVNLDIANGDFQQSGFKPEFTPKFDAYGEVTVGASIALPISVGIGITVNKFFDRKISLTSTAKAAASAKYAFDTENPGKCNNGIDWEIVVNEAVDADLLGFKQLDLFNVDLVKFGNCYLLGSKPTTPAPPTTQPDDSEQPAGSEQPDGSEQPAEPNQPTTPDQPEQPENPDQSEQPTDSDQSGQPSNPTESDQPTQGAEEQGDSADANQSATEDQQDQQRRRRLGRIQRRQATATSEVMKDPAVNMTMTSTATDSSNSTTVDTTGSRSNQTETEGEVQDIDSEFDADETDAQLDANLFNATDIAAAADANSTSTDSDDEPSYVFLSAWDTTELGVGEDDNLYLYDSAGADSDKWLYLNGTFVSSADESLVFHYYADTMDALGVSRLRVSETSSIPVTADVLTFLAVRDTEAGKAGIVQQGADLFPATTDGKIFYTVICDYEDPSASSKMFLVKDLDAGVARLVEDDLQYIVTGGAVQQCQYWPLKAAVTGLDL